MDGERSVLVANIENVLTIVRIVGTIIAIFMVLWVCFKFLVAVKNKDDEKKAKAKKMFVPMLIGALLIVFATSLVEWLWINSIAKPIIYIYPEQEVNLRVELGNPELITTSYPNYFEYNGWNVKANPNGDLEDKNTNKKLYSLYWEGKMNNINNDLSEGFVVKGEEVADFLDEKLEILGLNYKEREEFIVYWLPRLEKNKYNFIRFALTDECNEYMPLIINEEKEDGTLEEADIDTLIRVLMIFKPLNHEIEVKEQELPKQERIGFTVVEWGGSEL